MGREDSMPTQERLCPLLNARTAERMLLYPISSPVLRARREKRTGVEGFLDEIKLWQTASARMAGPPLAEVEEGDGMRSHRGRGRGEEFFFSHLASFSDGSADAAPRG